MSHVHEYDDNGEKFNDDGKDREYCMLEEYLAAVKALIDCFPNGACLSIEMEPQGKPHYVSEQPVAKSTI